MYTYNFSIPKPNTSVYNNNPNIFFLSCIIDIIKSWKYIVCSVILQPCIKIQFSNLNISCLYQTILIYYYLSAMFTGIIEYTGRVEGVTEHGLNKTFTIISEISKDLKVDQSVAHSGVCLTVESITNNSHTVTAIEETLKKTCLHNWQQGTEVNIERCMLMNGRLDGHIVQGHVDDVAVCTTKTDCNGSWEFTFTFHEKFAHLVIEKGSICINGISLTCFNITRNSLQVAIVPYTYIHTNMQHIEVGTAVNIEFDVLGKYISRMHELNKQ